MRPGSVLLFLLIVAALGRLLVVWPAPADRLPEPVDLPATLLASEQLTWGVEGIELVHVERQRFDPQAVVAIRPGPDRQPGVSGVDDNGNGRVDDKSELGATGSDDVCVVVPSGHLADQVSAGPILVLQRGAFVPATAQQAANSRDPTRVIFVGKSPGGKPWSVMRSAEFGVRNEEFGARE